MPKSTISRRLTRLEAELGAQLLRRTTHGIVATEQGTTFFEYTSRCLGLMRDGANAVQLQHAQPRGLLRLALPPELDRALVAPVIADYLARHPEVRLVTAISGAASDPSRAGFDLAIVADVLPQAEASLVTTKIGRVDTALFAARDYVEKAGLPQSHVDLARFDLIASGSADGRAQWVLAHDSSSATVDFRPRLACDDAALLRQAVLAGLVERLRPLLSAERTR